jgi:hypothetical protein
VHLAPAAIFVARVASGRAIREAAHALVLVDGLCLLVRRGGVAIDAGKTGVVQRYLVAIIANRPVVRNREVGVIEGGAQPAGRCVARIAGGWITRGNMVWHRTAERLRAVPLRQMAAVTGGVRGSERIIVVHVAIGAGLHTAGGGHHMSPGQGPTRRAVVELSIRPKQRVVAGRTQ